MDRSTPHIVEALGRAAAHPLGLALHGAKNAPGLFAATTVGKQAAQHCKDEGYLRVVGAETRGKVAQEVCAITEKGLVYLLQQVSPRQVLQEMVQTLQARQSETGELLAVARQMQAGIDALKAVVERVLEHVDRPHTNGAPVHDANAWLTAVRERLAGWQASGASEDCPLPELYRHARESAPHLTIGQFQDGLRGLHDRGQIYLHPWTGPLYELPEPTYALLAGHEIAYYASVRR